MRGAREPGNRVRAADGSLGIGAVRRAGARGRGVHATGGDGTGCAHATGRADRVRGRLAGATPGRERRAGAVVLRAGPGPAGCGSAEGRCLLNAGTPPGPTCRPATTPLGTSRPLDLAQRAGAPPRRTAPTQRRRPECAGAPGRASVGGPGRTYPAPAAPCQTRAIAARTPFGERSFPRARTGPGTSAPGARGGRPAAEITRPAARRPSRRPPPCADRPAGRSRA